MLLPLIQVASIWVLLGSSVIALFRGQRFMSPLHGLAYALMFVGGCLPATGGLGLGLGLGVGVGLGSGLGLGTVVHTLGAG